MDGEFVEHVWEIKISSSCMLVFINAKYIIHIIVFSFML